MVVSFVVATARSIPRTITSVGALDSPEMTTVASEIEGRVVQLDVREGRRVEAGHRLALLDDAEPKASLRVAAARLQNARDRLARLERLRAQSVSSDQAHEDARAEFDALQAAYQELDTRLEKTAIRAPFTGVLGLRQVNVGDYVTGGTPITELTQVDPLELIFGIPQRFAGDLAEGQTVRGRVGRCGPRFEGRVDAIDPRVERATRSVKLQAIVSNPEGTLFPGMAVSLQLVVGEIENAIFVPQEAIVRQGTKHIVYTLDDDDMAVQRTVALGQFLADGVHVRSGVEPGARVVAAGQQKLRQGAKTAPEAFERTQNPNLVLGLDALEDCGGDR